MLKARGLLLVPFRAYTYHLFPVKETHGASPLLTKSPTDF